MIKIKVNPQKIKVNPKQNEVKIKLKDQIKQNYPYTGDYVIIPSGQEQIIPVQGFRMVQDLVIEPIPPISTMDIYLYDFDGVILYAYTAEDFLTLSHLPSYPVHDGLNSLGWNWSLQDAKDYVRANGFLNMQAQYSIPEDGFEFEYMVGWKNRAVMFGIYVVGSVEVDWGDGYIESFNGDDPNIMTGGIHTYPEPQHMIDPDIYDIYVNVVDGSAWLPQFRKLSGPPVIV